MLNAFLFILLHLSVISVVSLIFYIKKSIINKNLAHNIFIVILWLVFIWSSGLLLQKYATFYFGHSLMVLTYYYSFGLYFISSFFAIFAYLYTKQKNTLNIKHGMFFIIPVICYLLLLTNKYHHLIFVRYSIDENVVYGKILLLLQLYLAVVYIGSLFYIIYFLVHNHSIFSKQVAILCFSVLIPFTVNIIIIFRLIKLPLYANPTSVTISMILLYFGLIKYDFLKINLNSLNVIANAISDAFVIVNKMYRVIGYNEAFKNLFGTFSYDKQNNFYEKFSDDEYKNHIDSAINKKEKNKIERKIKLPNTDKYFIIEFIPLLSLDYVNGIIILFRDISELKAVQDKLILNERYVSLGMLMGGIAHNMKSPLMAISANIDTLNSLVNEYEESISDNSITIEDHKEIAGEMRSWLDKTYKTIEYMNKILNSVRGQALSNSNEQFDIEEVIDQVKVFIRSELSKNNCILDTLNSVANVKLTGSVSSLVQVLNNIIINAIHSYNGESGIIKLTVTEKNGDIIISVKDNGTGIDKDIQKYLFKEMITTKGKNGTGLGMYISYAIIKTQFKGDIWFESEPGKGTVFNISIPILREV